ncbi:MAG: nicotinate (nicotinamide) nucleotide adenylyltransferase [Spirochaetales bacterium]|nr:nicotinate (nicotinamide) nucleotide adenylyltransferase [Spirochaetales bacterium]
MKIAIIGGSFNPPHLAHLQLACELYSLGEYKKVVFVPSNISAHKQTKELISAEHRLIMLHLCINPAYMEVDDCEIKRGGISYTVDTLDYFREKYAEKPAFVIGDDLLDGFAGWKQPDSIAEKADLFIAHRQQRKEQPFAWQHRYLSNPALDISSSDIRKRVCEGRKISYLVTAEVEQYIYTRGLYC